MSGTRSDPDVCRPRGGEVPLFRPFGSFTGVLTDFQLCLERRIRSTWVFLFHRKSRRKEDISDFFPKVPIIVAFLPREFFLESFILL